MKCAGSEAADPIKWFKMQAYSFSLGCFPRGPPALASRQTTFHFWKCILLNLLSFPQKVRVGAGSPAPPLAQSEFKSLANLPASLSDNFEQGSV